MSVLFRNPTVDLFDRVLSTADSRGAFSPKREREERDETKFELKTSRNVEFFIGRVRMHFRSRGKRGGKEESESAFARSLGTFPSCGSRRQRFLGGP